MRLLPFNRKTAFAFAVFLMMSAMRPIVPSPMLLMHAFDSPDVSDALPFLAERTARPTASWRLIRFTVNLSDVLRYGFYSFFVGCRASALDTEDRGRLWLVYSKLVCRLRPVGVSGECFFDGFLFLFLVSALICF